MTSSSELYKKQDFQLLIDTFRDWNQKINLSAIRDDEWIRQKHILDSLELHACFGLWQNKTLIDVWTWGGFPLLPLAQTCPTIQCTWLDTRHKKILAVQQIADTCGLTNVKLLRWRAEQHTQTYDYCTVRAVAYIHTLFDRTYHLLKPGGFRVLYKLYTSEEERDIHIECKRRWLSVRNIHEYELQPWSVEDAPQAHQRRIYILQKHF